MTIDEQITQPLPRLSEKPTLKQLSEWHQITLFDVVRVSRLRPMRVWAAFANRGIKREIACCVITAFNYCCETHYTLHQVNLCILQDRQ